MTFNPITHDDGTRDKRYEVALEHCGYETPRYVLRFCGEYLGNFRNIPGATLRAVGHRNVLNGAEIITEKKG